MASLPTTIDTPMLSGAEMPATGTPVTDLGLGQAAEAFQAASVQQRRASRVVIEAQAKTDREAIQPQVQALRSGVVDAYAKAAAGLTPDNAAGFANGQLAAVRAQVNGALSDPKLTPGQHAQLRLAGEGIVSSVGNAAIEHEANVGAQPIADQVRAQKNIDLMNGLNTFFSNYSGPSQDLDDSYDGSTNDYAPRKQAAFQTAVEATKQQVSPEVWPELSDRLTSIGVSDVSKAWQVQAAGQAKYQYTQAHQAGQAAINGVFLQPNSYDAVNANVIPQLVSNAPAKFRPQLEKEWGKELAYARLTGLSDNGDPGQAEVELKSGRFNADFTPEEMQGVLTHIHSAQQFHSPRTLDEAAAALDVKKQADAETYALATTGQTTGVPMAQITKTLGPMQAAEYQAKWNIARQTFAAVGDARGASNEELGRTAALPAPNPGDPDYAAKLETWQYATQAAQNEIKARQSGAGAWAFASNKPAPGKMGKAQAAQGATDRGQILQDGYAAWQAASDPAARSKAGTNYASYMLWSQDQAGIPRASMQILPQQEAARMAAGVNGAAPEQRGAALQGVASMLLSTPDRMRMPDGTTMNPRALFVQQLKASHMSLTDISAALDFGGDAGALGKYVAARNDPTLQKPPSKADANALKAAIPAALKLYLDSVRPMPGEADLEQARIDRTTLMARELMAQGQSAGDAAKAAAQAVAGGYQFKDGYRIPTAVAGSTELNPLDTNFLKSPGDLISRGAANVLRQVTGENGQALFAPDGPGTADNRRRLAAEQISKFGHWVTNGDDSGLTLMVPGADGNGWKVAGDRYGRAITATWDQLKSQSDFLSSSWGKLGFGSPPPAAARDLSGKPVEAIGPGAAFSALKQSIRVQEGGATGQVNGKGAGGIWQLMPATVSDYAGRLHLPTTDFNKVIGDDKMSEQVATAALTDHLRRFGNDGVGMALSAIAYNAGAGRLVGYKDDKGQYHPGWLRTIGDPRQIGLQNFINRIPIQETRDYVKAVLPRALQIAQRGG